MNASGLKAKSLINAIMVKHGCAVFDATEPNGVKFVQATQKQWRAMVDEANATEELEPFFGTVVK